MQTILNTDTCRILFDGKNYTLLMRMGNNWVKNAPFPGELRGLVAAMTLSLDVISGKVWPHEITDQNGLPVEFTSNKPKQIVGA